MQAEGLLRFTEKSPMLEAFDDQLFKRFVERIVIHLRHEAVFQLKCGLTLTERMGKSWDTHHTDTEPKTAKRSSTKRNPSR